MIGELEITQSYMKIYFVCQSAIDLVNYQMYHERTKHINIHLYFVRGVIESNEIAI